MNTSIAEHDAMPGMAFRPWNTDSLATIRSNSPAGLVIEYDHAPGVRHFIERKKDLERMGRVVARSDFRGLS